MKNASAPTFFDKFLKQLKRRSFAKINDSRAVEIEFSYYRWKYLRKYEKMLELRLNNIRLLARFFGKVIEVFYDRYDEFFDRTVKPKVLSQKKKEFDKIEKHVKPKRRANYAPFDALKLRAGYVSRLNKLAKVYKVLFKRVVKVKKIKQRNFFAKD